ncbi:MAG: hypothetical protein V3V14_02345 [Saprospiraceae bacterium]
MKKSLLLTLLIVSITSLYGQRLKIAEELSVDMKKNVVDLSFGGSGQFLSLNYTRVLKIEKKYFISGLIGVGTTLFTDYQGYSDSEGGTSIPHQLSINFGKKNAFF